MDEKETPRYDVERRELWVGSECVLRLTPTETTEHAILKAFQDRGWPENISIDDLPEQDADLAN